jgi:hypothetical protein
LGLLPAKVHGHLPILFHLLQGCGPEAVGRVNSLSFSSAVSAASSINATQPDGFLRALVSHLAAAKNLRGGYVYTFTGLRRGGSQDVVAGTCEVVTDALSRRTVPSVDDVRAIPRHTSDTLNPPSSPRPMHTAQLRDLILTFPFLHGFIPRRVSLRACLPACLPLYLPACCLRGP